MTTFDWHIIRRLTTGYLFLVAALIVFFILLHYLEYVDDFLDRGATMQDIFLVYYPSYVPDIVRLISPLALFLACVYLTGKLAQELQLAALQTSGVSLFRLMRPYLAVALVVTGFMFWFNGWVVPVTNRTVLDFEMKHLKDAPRQIDVSNVHRQNRPGHLLSVGFFDRRDSSAQRISLQRFADDQRLVERIDAPRMEWIDSTDSWRLRDVVVRHFDPLTVPRRERLDSLDTQLSVFPRDLARTERDVDSMTIPAAASYVEALRRSGAGGLGRTLVGYYSKFAYPFANLILIGLGVPLAAVRRRGGQAVQIGLGLLTAFAYLAAQKLAEPFGYAGDLTPLLAAWLPHVAFAGLALMMLVLSRN